ncbi:uncharacterized protein LOC123527432 [Mercenaria mercenaria]|uniref:uncharacterized protein LOC123527432 n=1 Tax=Mercenaria mercenaria TaxID=6596 RepID=UPI00234E8CB9|nr:uncharacterized protein LOC123527432 [Mercenaria mercenaria]XP_045162818.2 uncharacterized protein LOC123527432 [Mercenaria mercenaria]
MAELFPTIESNGFQNWLKAALALLFAKQGLQGFVCEEVTQFQNDLLLAIFAEKSLPSGTICNECTTENVLPCPTPNFCPTGRCKLHDHNKSDKKPYRQCRSSICQEIQKVIQREHRYNKPSWKNTNATKWCTDAFDIAKCYMPPDGYAAVATLEYTDFSGTLAVIINNKRFQNKMAAKLHQQNNICIQAREVGRKIRHSADFAVSDPELIKYIETLINLLSDTKHLAVDQKAREAVDKLKLLKSKALTVTTSDITTVLDDALKAIVAKQCDDALQDVRAEKDKAQAEIDEKMGALVKLLEGVKASIANMPTVATSSLDEIIATKVSALNELNRATESSLATLETKGKQIQEELRKEFGIQRQTRSLYLTDQKELETCMRDDLIEFYRKYHNTILVAPLVEELDVPLCEFYVQPPLTSLNVRKMYGISKQHTKTPVNSYHDLFFHGDDNIYQHIFVKANAGVGKTSFAKRICMTWCQAHNPVESLKTKFKQEDVDALRKYDLLFLLSLRNQDPSECDIDNMICSGVLRELAKSSSYTMHALQDVLCTSTCLVVLDGLDEWSHPANCTRGRPDDLPHIPARKQCSVLMTTRPWKLDVANPRMSQIDKIVEINELDTSLSEQLITNAITVLNNQAVTNQSKTTEEFQKATSTLKLDTMRYIPYILLQMVCL